MRLKARTAVVTGASMGIGAATATALAERGVKVWAVARNQERLEQVAGGHDSIHPLVADVTIEEDRERLIEATGPVDIVVNNAGFGLFGSISAMTATEVRELFETNVMALIDLTQRYVPGMLQQRSGHICNVGSSISYFPGPPLTVYGATKAAVHGFTDGLRRELVATGVHASLIQPGPVSTGFWERASKGNLVDIVQSGTQGVPASWVARAIVRAIRFDRVPGYATVGVPRVIGLGRALDLPGVSYAFDLAMGLAGRTNLDRTGQR